MSTEYRLVLAAPQAAARLGLSTSTLAKMRLSRTGPQYSKLGRRVVYQADDLEAWVKSNLCQSTSEYGRRPR